MGYPVQRLRRLRSNEVLREMVREHKLDIDDLIMPLFTVHGNNIKNEIETLPLNYRMSIDVLLSEVEEINNLGIKSILLFGLPAVKDDSASEAYAPDGIVQKAIRSVKERFPKMIVISDVCLCEYTPHGHCGIIENGYLNNDRSLELLTKTALSHAQAGADMLAPAAMLDGQVKSIRTILDQNRFFNVGIMGYSAKYASKLYDPFFKHGTQSVVAFGDKRTHQMDFGNAEEALREIDLDIQEGADIVMVKPGFFYLDIVYRAKQRFGMPMAVFNVSGEYAMLTAAAQLGRLDLNSVMLEALTSMKRAGADLIITYHAKQAAKVLRESYL